MSRESLPSGISTQGFNLSLVFEDKIQEQQQQRIEREIDEDPTPVSPGMKSLDKGSSSYIETIPKSG